MHDKNDFECHKTLKNWQEANDSRWLIMTQDESKWVKMTQDDSRWLKMAENVTRLKIIDANIGLILIGLAKRLVPYVCKYVKNVTIERCSCICQVEKLKKFKTSGFHLAIFGIKSYFSLKNAIVNANRYLIRRRICREIFCGYFHERSIVWKAQF